MARRPLVRCAIDPTCPELFRPGQQCPTHRRPDRRPSASARGYGVKWRRIRAAYLRAHPTCEREGCEKPSVDVHHLDGAGPNGDNRWSNLLALCTSHHSRETARMRTKP